MDRLVAFWPLISALQPVDWSEEGVICAPRAASELAASALRRLPLPVDKLDRVPAWPEPCSDHVAGWYRRSPVHVAAPPGVRELISTAGEGFGLSGHETTTMCLRALERIPPGSALDAGCGAGLLTQAWIALGRGPVLAIDLDPRALDQARRSLEAAGRIADVRLLRAHVGALDAQELADRVVLANLPAGAQRDLVARVRSAPRAVLLSGVRPRDGAHLAAAWRSRGLRLAGADGDGRFVCLRLVRA